MSEALYDPGARRDALAARLFEATLGAFDLLAIHLGLDLGLYRALERDGPATASELAARAGVHSRYAREWLEHQAVTGILDADASDDPLARRYWLPGPHAEVLLDPDHLATMAPMPMFVMAAARTWPALLEAYRTGGGVDWNDYPGLSEAQELANRPLFQQLLADVWLPAIPDVHARLSAGGARVADVAAGAGWSSIAMARGYPGITVDGLDLDALAIERARENARAAGLADRVRFHVVDAGDHSLDGQFDLVTIFEAVHDLARPVEVLRAVELAADRVTVETTASSGDVVTAIGRATIVVVGPDHPAYGRW